MIVINKVSSLFENMIAAGYSLINTKAAMNTRNMNRNNVQSLYHYCLSECYDENVGMTWSANGKVQLDMVYVSREYRVGII
jgi:hypothetical protein